MSFFIRTMYSSGTLIIHFSLIQVKRTQKKKFRCDSAKLKRKFKNSMHG